MTEWMDRGVCVHVWLLAVCCWLGVRSLEQVCYLRLIAKLGVPLLGQVCQLQLIAKLRILLLGQVCYLQLCWAIYAAVGIVAGWMNHGVCMHTLLLAVYCWAGVPSLGWVCYLQLTNLSWGSHHWDRFAIYSLLLSWGSHCWDRFASYSLLLSWGSHCWDRFAIYSFAKLGVPAGTGLFMQLLARFWYFLAWVIILWN